MRQLPCRMVPKITIFMHKILGSLRITVTRRMHKYQILNRWDHNLTNANNIFNWQFTIFDHCLFSYTRVSSWLFLRGLWSKLSNLNNMKTCFTVNFTLCNLSSCCTIPFNTKSSSLHRAGNFFSLWAPKYPMGSFLSITYPMERERLRWRHHAAIQAIVHTCLML